MKKVILVVALVVLIISLGIVEQFFIKQTFEQLQEKSQEIYQSLMDENYEIALRSTQEVKEWWYTKRDILELICPNNDIKEIAREIGELEGSQLAEMYDDSITRSNVLLEMAKNSHNLLKYKWKNVL